MINLMQECPQCYSKSYRKNGRVRGKQRYLCKECGRQFLEIQSPPKFPEKSQDGISIILLDLENLKLDALAENYLQKIASYPLQIKLAFANWSEKGVLKQDTELYERGYFLVHVPGGKNSADARMMTLGAAIRIHYPQVEEVFVCSSDWLLTNLSNELLSQNLKVWRVRRQNKLLEIENRKTRETYAYSLELNQEIPEPKALLNKLEELIAQEQNSITDKVQEISQLEALLNIRKELTDQKPEAEINDSEVSSPIENNGKTLSKTQPYAPSSHQGAQLTSKTEILCAEDLECAIALVIEELQIHFPKKKVTPSTISNRFKDRFEVTANQLIKDLKVGTNITHFLEHRPHLFTVHPKTKQVSIILENQPTTIKPNIPSSQPIKNRDDLKKILLKLVESFIKNSGQLSIPITTLGADFKVSYGKSVSTVMKTLKITGNFTKFLQSCEEFKLKKSGKAYHVTINDQ